MKNKNRYIILGIVIIAIIAAIILLQKNATSVSSQIKNFSVNTVKEGKYQRAVEISGGTGYVNTESNFNISSLVGNKVVVVDFWTYSCINCLRTIPYLNSWYQKYKDSGLEIVGVHTPEFSFEKDYSNVKSAVEKLGIKYPVILDSNYSIWNSYHNQYWPAEYIIDSDGYIVETHFGEGDYNTTENTIQTLLEERAKKLNINIYMNNTVSAPADIVPIDFSSVRSPETYFGSNRNSYLADGIQGKSGVQNLSLPAQLDYNQLYLVGLWNISSEYASPLSDDAKIVYGYNSKNVYVVASSSRNEILRATLDNNLTALIPIGPYNIYSIVLGESYGIHALELSNLSKNMQFYTFTFG